MENGSKKRVVFLRNDIGILVRQNEACFSKLASAKLQHEKADSKFFANLWCFKMLKSAYSPSVYWGKFIFLYRDGCTDFKQPFNAKMTSRQN